MEMSRPQCVNSRPSRSFFCRLRSWYSSNRPVAIQYEDLLFRFERQGWWAQGIYRFYVNIRGWGVGGGNSEFINPLRGPSQPKLCTALWSVLPASNSSLLHSVDPNCKFFVRLSDVWKLWFSYMYIVGSWRRKRVVIFYLVYMQCWLMNVSPLFPHCSIEPVSIELFSTLNISFAFSSKMCHFFQEISEKIL